MKEVNTQWTHLRRFAIDQTSKFYVESRAFINFERRIHAEIITSIRRGFEFQNRQTIDEFSAWIFLCHFDVELTQLLYSLFPFYQVLIFSAVGTYSKLIWYSQCNFNDIDVITDIGTIGTIFFGNFATTQINLNKYNFYLLQNNTNKDYNANIYK